MLKGSSELQAVKVAGITKSAKACIREAKHSIQQQLNKQGLTVAYLNERLKQQIVADKRIPVTKDTKLVDVPDNQARDSALTLAYKLHGALKDRQTIIDNRQVTFSGDANQLAQVVKEMQRLKQADSIDVTGDVIE